MADKRKKWQKKDQPAIMTTPKRHERVNVAKQTELPAHYEDYLLMLEQRNRLLANVKLTDKKQLDLEKKEKGFALYVNGANSKILNKKITSPSPRAPSNTKLRIASELDTLSKRCGDGLPSSSRTRSAPERAEKQVRKNWNTSSVNIQTARGEKMHVHAPSDITGNYSEDFEDVTETVHTDSDDTDTEGDNSKINNKIMLTLDDVTKLRKSLQLSRGIQESLSLSNQSITLPELSDDSEEEPELMKLQEQRKSSNSAIKADSTIVLEFEPPKITNKKADLTCRSVTKNGTPRKSVNRNVEMRMSNDAKRSSSTSLSAVKKKDTRGEPTTLSNKERSDLMAAMEKENSAASEYIRKSKDGSVQKKKNPLRDSEQVVSSDLRDVEERVLQMQPEQQKNLIETLFKIEQTVRPTSTQVSSRQSQTALDRFQTNDREVHKVHLEWLTNWGHDNLIGLTEIAILDEHNKRIDVNTDFIRLDGATNCHGSETVLFSNKYKTTKERHMFCCQQSGHKPVTFSFRVEIPLGSRINKIKIWNYNRSLNDISMGVCRMRIRIDDDVIYDGEIDKGCGNPVFDYGYTIVVGSDAIDEDSDSPEELKAPPISNTEPSVKKSRKSTEMWISLDDKGDKPKSPERCVTRILNHSTLDESFLPNVEKERYGDVTESNKSSKRNPVPKLNLNDSRNNSTPQPISPVKSKLPWMDKLTGQAERSRSPQLEQWITENKTDNVRNSLDDMLESLDKWEKGKEKGELKTIFDDDTNNSPNKKQTSSRRPKFDKPQPMEVASEIEEKIYRQAAVEETESSPPVLVKSDVNSVARARRRKWQANDLEASWSSLDMFQKSHRGRLSMEGDALDEYLNETKVEEEKKLDTINEDAKINRGGDEFIIPELPRGQELVINIKSTWGDKYYVGLNGIELFSETGEPVTFNKITASPSDINMLPEYENDPRVVSNLIDGVNKTRDDVHMWLTPFTAGSKHFICVSFTQPFSIALMRIWNYNKSRIHSYRGAKEIEISLDGRYIFKGEVARACGGMQGGTEAFGDTILFTTDDGILDLVSRHDGQYTGGAFSSDDEWADDVPYSARPPTADKGESDRPLTTVLGKGMKKLTIDSSNKKHEEVSQQAVPVAVDGTTLVYRAQRVTLNFRETWGDPHYLGLTGIELVSKSGDAVLLDLNMLHAEPRDLHVLPGYQSDDRTLDKVIDGVNITTSDEHMWLVPYTEGNDHILDISLPQHVEIVGVRFWNYNKSHEDTYRGAKTVHISLDGCLLSPPGGFLIRKGPGNCYYDFAQELLFSDTLRLIQLDAEMEVKQLAKDDETDCDDDSDYVISGNMPKGFVYQFHLMSTHADLYYLGLNSIEFYDAEGRKIKVDENSIAAYPESVNVLENITGDVRTPDKLLLEHDGENMWLAPILPNITNRLFVIFDYPQTVSMIKIWNYNKTPNRGVKDFALLVDDLLIYNGTLDAARYSTGILPNTYSSAGFHTILFTNNKAIRNKVKHTIIKNTSEFDDIQLTNDNQVVSKSNKKSQEQTADQALRPKTGMVKPGFRRNR